jgi:hypothetical protein
MRLNCFEKHLTVPAAGMAQVLLFAKQQHMQTTHLCLLSCACGEHSIMRKHSQHLRRQVPPSFAYAAPCHAFLAHSSKENDTYPVRSTAIITLPARDESIWRCSAFWWNV